RLGPALRAAAGGRDPPPPPRGPGREPARGAGAGARRPGPRRAHRRARRHSRPRQTAGAGRARAPGGGQAPLAGAGRRRGPGDRRGDAPGGGPGRLRAGLVRRANPYRAFLIAAVPLLFLLSLLVRSSALTGLSLAWALLLVRSWRAARRRVRGI